jgi:hypothetical protein
VSARDALAQVKRDMATRTDGDAPSREVLIAAETIVIEHAPRLVEALEAVLDAIDRADPPGAMKAGTAVSVAVLRSALSTLEDR